MYECCNISFSAQTVDPVSTHLGPCLCAKVEEEHEGWDDAHLNLHFGARMCIRVQEFRSSYGFTQLQKAQHDFEFVPVLASCHQKILFAKVAPRL